MVTGWRRGQRHQCPAAAVADRQLHPQLDQPGRHPRFRLQSQGLQARRLPRRHAAFQGNASLFPHAREDARLAGKGSPCHPLPAVCRQPKYGFRNRALRAFVDLLAVRWMKSRYIRYSVTEVVAEPVRETAPTARRGDMNSHGDHRPSIGGLQLVASARGNAAARGGRAGTGSRARPARAGRNDPAR